jgi:nucleoside-triphosphatase THEP1
MEFKSEFIGCTKNLLELRKPMIIVVYKRLQQPLIDQFRKKVDFVIDIDLQNRGRSMTSCWTDCNK